MRTMQFTEENIGEILRLLAGILHAGNIEFMTAGGAQVSSKSGQRVSPRLRPSFMCSAVTLKGLTFVSRARLAPEVTLKPH